MKYTSISEVGGRAVNEDSVCVKIENGMITAVVADGLGGCGGGKIASEAAVKSLCENSDLLTSFRADEIKNAFDLANESVLSCQTDMVKMKSTALVLIADTVRKHYMCAHIGDSRLYHFKDGRIDFQTKDHTVSRVKADIGEIDYEQIRYDCDRNKLLRALGVKPEKNNISIRDLGESGDGSEKNAFLLCTDGFWEYVFENEMEECLKESSSPEEWLNRMILLHDSRIPVNCDNYTAVVFMDE